MGLVRGLVFQRRTAATSKTDEDMKNVNMYNEIKYILAPVAPSSRLPKGEPGAPGRAWLRA